MSETYDLIVIGAGMAGVAAANKCGAAGWRVAIVDAARLMDGKGIDPRGVLINWSDLMAYKRGFTDPVPDKMEKGLTGNGVETLHGAARFTSANALEVDGNAYGRAAFSSLL